MRPAFHLIIILLTGSLLFSKCLFAQDWNGERWKLEILSTTLIPTQRTANQGSFFGTGDGFSQTTFPKIAYGVEVNSSFATAKRTIGKSAWFLELNIGVGLEALFLVNENEVYTYRSNGFVPHPPTITNFRSRNFQLTTFVDNVLLFTKQMEKLEVGVGLNFRCLYTFYNYSATEGEEEVVGTGDSHRFSESSSELWDLGFWLDNAIDASYVFQGVLTVRPVSMKGFFCSMRLPLQPVVKVSTARIKYHGFSLGIGYRF